MLKRKDVHGYMLTNLLLLENFFLHKELIIHFKIHVKKDC